jgi:hypothetical protein
VAATARSPPRVAEARIEQELADQVQPAGISPRRVDGQEPLPAGANARKNELCASVAVEVTGGNQRHTALERNRERRRRAVEGSTSRGGDLFGKPLGGTKRGRFKHLDLAVAVDVDADLSTCATDRSHLDFQRVGILFERPGAKSSRWLDASHRDSTASLGANAFDEVVIVFVGARTPPRIATEGGHALSESAGSHHREQPCAPTEPRQDGELSRGMRFDEPSSAVIGNAPGRRTGDEPR